VIERRQVYLLFDNIELFLIFAGDQLGRLKVRWRTAAAVVALVTVAAVLLSQQTIPQTRHVIAPQMTPICSGSFVPLPHSRP
jgi:K+/H+ antiporter YhaU regulatory subunit KhtT